MLQRYKCTTVTDYENALKEIIQEISLLGLWRAKFFEHAAFYGGTALRILYGLDRFSEDLDFSLLKPQNAFKFAPYLRAVEAELTALGFSVIMVENNKKIDSSIDSAFIKAGTKEHLIKINLPARITDKLQKNTLLQIKLEIDTDPPSGFSVEAKTLLQPIPFSVNTYMQPDLFAGKIHAILQRNWKNRVKGRDYYDFVWYIARDVPVRLGHLEQRLRQSKGFTHQKSFNLKSLHHLLQERFSNLDFDSAKKDVIPFLRDPAAVELWSADFFTSLIHKIKIV